jgi:ABC-type antimicrobial peptide transport system permease subunit
MADRLSKSMALNRLIVGNFCLFSSIALLMAIVGVYGVFSYVVGRRTQEIGIRIALGARKRDVLWVILKENLVFALIGIVIGVIGALMIAPLMRSLLVGISPFDPITFVGISLLLTVVSMLACWLPACRAMKVQPMEALRYE